MSPVPQPPQALKCTPLPCQPVPDSDCPHNHWRLHCFLPVPCHCRALPWATATGHWQWHCEWHWQCHWPAKWPAVVPLALCQWATGRHCHHCQCQCVTKLGCQAKNVKMGSFGPTLGQFRLTPGHLCFCFRSINMVPNVRPISPDVRSPPSVFVRVALVRSR